MRDNVYYILGVNCEMPYEYTADISILFMNILDLSEVRVI